MFSSSNWLSLKSKQKKKRKFNSNNSKKVKFVKIDNVNTAKSQNNKEITKQLAIDCEMCGVGKDGKQSQLARCSIVNFHGHTVYDVYIKPKLPITDYRTHVSGISGPNDFQHAIEFKQCQEQVLHMIKNKILIGHGIKNDLNALLITHPSIDIRDTSTYKEYCPYKPIKLKKLVSTYLIDNILDKNTQFQVGSHDSVMDAKAVLMLYKLKMNKWENDIKKRKHILYSKLKKKQNKVNILSTTIKKQKKKEKKKKK